MTAMDWEAFCERLSARRELCEFRCLRCGQLKFDRPTAFHSQTLGIAGDMCSRCAMEWMQALLLMVDDDEGEDDA